MAKPTRPAAPDVPTPAGAGRGTSDATGLGQVMSDPEDQGAAGQPLIDSAALVTASAATPSSRETSKAPDVSATVPVLVEPKMLVPSVRVSEKAWPSQAAATLEMLTEYVLAGSK